MGISDHSGEKKNGQAETHPAESVMSRFSHIQDAHRVQRDCQTEVWVPRALLPRGGPGWCWCGSSTGRWLMAGWTLRMEDTNPSCHCIVSSVPCTATVASPWGAGTQVTDTMPAVTTVAVLGFPSASPANLPGTEDASSILPCCHYLPVFPGCSHLPASRLVGTARLPKLGRHRWVHSTPNRPLPRTDSPTVIPGDVQGSLEHWLGDRE